VARALAGAGDREVLEAAARVHPLDLLGEEDQRGHRGGVVGLVLARVVQRGGQAQEVRDVAARAGDLVDALERRGAEEGEPEAAVGGERLLRREVVRVGLRGVERRPPAPEVASMTTRPSPCGRWTGTITPVEVSLWAQATMSQPGSWRGAGASPGSALSTPGPGGTGPSSCRRRTSPRTRRRSGAARARGRGRRSARPTARWCRRCQERPRSRRAARTARAGPRGSGRRPA
jgi:hypothetical protein